MGSIVCCAGVKISWQGAFRVVGVVTTAVSIWCRRGFATVVQGAAATANKTKMTTPQCPRLSPHDPNSFSNPENVRVEHMHIKWTVDFLRKVIGGSVTYRLTPVTSPVRSIVFDTRLLSVNKIQSGGGKALEYKVGNPLLNFGQPLTIETGDLFDNAGGNPVEIEVHYETSPNSSALQWLEPQQTAGKKHPYVFSQCEMIHARSLLPCQDTPYSKSTYSAEVTVPKDLQALMSAIVSKDDDVVSGDSKTNKFVQKIPIPAYLIAIAVGNIKGKKIGPRSTVWTEPELLDASVYEFAETEKMLSAAEQLMGEYVWGVYDILVLPPSFPMGGMENPTLTFATPTLLAGDRSLVDVIAHEIAHSWTGNLVTNKNFEHFWLNEGFTVFAERKIVGLIKKDEKFRQFSCISGWSGLCYAIETLKPDNPMTKLVTDLTGEDPDEHFSTVPYEKGSVFLFYLETVVGGPSVFEPFLKHYIQTNRFKSIDTDVFKNMFIEYFTKSGKAEAIKAIDWDGWLYTPGMPLVHPKFDTTLADVCTKLKNKWVAWKPSEGPGPFNAGDFSTFFSSQIELFLSGLLDEKDPIPLTKVKAMQTAYDFNSYKNCEIKFRWLRLCMKAKWKEALPLALQFVTEQGRLKYVRPLYRDMYNWTEVRAEAIEHFNKTKSNMMSMSVSLVAKDLHLQ